MKAQRLADDLNRALRSAVGAPSFGVEDAEIFPGANPWSLRPTMICRLAGDRLDSCEGIGRLAEAYPRLFKPGDEVGVAEALVRIIVWPLANLQRLDSSGGSNGPTLWFEFLTESAAVQALKTALIAVAEAIAGAPGEAAAREQKHADWLCDDQRINFQSQILMTTARLRGVPWLQVGTTSAIWQFGWGKNSDLFWETSSNADGLVAQSLGSNKSLGKQLFNQLGLPTPASRTIGDQQDHRAAARAIGWPCVVKPLDRGSGKGVTTNIRSEADLDAAVALARSYSPTILIEAHQEGDDHRLMVVDGELVCAVRREPSWITGDGVSTVRQLIAALNADRQGTLRESRYLSPVAEDDALATMLRRSGLTLDSVLEEGRRFILRSNANRSTGGVAFDVTQSVHPQIRDFAVHMADALGYRVTGIDYVTPDITRPHAEAGGAFLETNSVPGMCVLVAAGMTEEEIGDYVLPRWIARIPLTLLIVAEGQAEEMRAALSARVREMPATGFASSRWAQVGNMMLPGREGSAIARACSVLRYKSVGAAIILWTDQEMMRLGLPVDKADKIILAGAEIEAEWRLVLDRLSSSVTVCTSVEEAVGRAS